MLLRRRALTACVKDAVSVEPLSVHERRERDSRTSIFERTAVDLQRCVAPLSVPDERRKRRRVGVRFKVPDPVVRLVSSREDEGLHKMLRSAKHGCRIRTGGQVEQQSQGTPSRCG